MNLTAFLKTGKYLELKIGSPENDVHSIFSKKVLGQKHYFDNSNKNEGFSYFCDALEIMITDSKIYSLGFDLARCPVTILNNLSICNETSFELILRYLDIADIEWAFEKKYCNGRELTIKTEGGVLLGCTYEKGNYWLSKIKIF
ncbi:hypothetical protein [Pseudomonas protegens]|uniref:hypothetical protein n=1 Tax=Pseudomonas protegens TaxID=380021 RepID=UPI002756DB63|nr:hypothetical protein [Pseudomonas protegens]MDP9530913.1 hypothetical protein [Pseudomonas protegens]